MTETYRCKQCRWTIPPSRLEQVTLPDGTVVNLHRGGCPPRGKDA